MDTNRNLTTQEVRDLKNQWQQTPQVDLPGLFYALNGGLNERVVSFKMEQAQLGAFLSFSTIHPDPNLSIKLHLGKNNLDPHIINPQPPFEPIIQLVDMDSAADELTNCWSLIWDNSNNFLNRSQSSNFSTEISQVASYSFIYEWAQTPYNDIVSKFEGFTGTQVCRIELNRFDSSDVDKINEFYWEHQGDGTVTLYYHIGMGTIGNPLHPFVYCPIIELYFQPAPNSPKSPESLHLEFSYPCPPNCNQSGG